jgi:hypothetical protein
MKPVTRQKVNITIDIIMFLVMVALAVIGFIIRYVLIPGSERWEKYGRNVDLTCLGMDRHEWGYIHLILGILLLIMLVLHIVFHWTLVICLIKRLLPLRKWRYSVVGATIILSCVFAAFPFLLNPRTGAPIRGQGEGFWPLKYQEEMTTGFSEKDVEISIHVEPDKSDIPKQTDNHVIQQETEDHQNHQEERLLDIKGYNTIGELAAIHGISATELKKRLNIPSGVSNNEQLGRIRRIYGFTMREVEDGILVLKDRSN